MDTDLSTGLSDRMDNFFVSPVKSVSRAKHKPKVPNGWRSSERAEVPDVAEKDE